MTETISLGMADGHSVWTVVTVFGSGPQHSMA